MKAAPTLVALLLALPAAPCLAADDAPPKTSMKDLLRARLAADAKKAPPAASKAKQPATPATPTPAPAPVATDESPAQPPAGKSDPTMLPQVEVRKEKYSARDHQLALDLHKQDQEIERERKNLKVSETDLALNDAKVARPLSLFGGNSAQFRQRVAAERVELLEAEKDIIEQIAIAQKPEEKKLLQGQLDQLREMRRQLDQSLR